MITINDVEFIQSHEDGTLSHISISTNKEGKYSVKSSTNMIECVDCHKLISVHSLFCVACGCTTSHTLHTYFEKHAEEKRLAIELEQIRIKKEQEELERKKLEEEIRRKEEELHRIAEERRRLEEERKRKEEEKACILAEKKNRENLITSIPKSAQALLSQAQIDLISLDTPTLTKLSNAFNENFSKHEKELRDRIEKNKGFLFCQTVTIINHDYYLNLSSEDQDTINVIWNSYKKYLNGTYIYDQNHTTATGKQFKITLSTMKQLNNEFKRLAKNVLKESVQEGFISDSSTFRKHIEYDTLINNSIDNTKLYTLTSFNILKRIEEIDFLNKYNNYKNIAIGKKKAQLEEENRKIAEERKKQEEAIRQRKLEAEQKKLLEEERKRQEEQRRLEEERIKKIVGLSAKDVVYVQGNFYTRNFRPYPLSSEIYNRKIVTPKRDEIITNEPARPYYPIELVTALIPVKLPNGNTIKVNVNARYSTKSHKFYINEAQFLELIKIGEIQLKVILYDNGATSYGNGLDLSAESVLKKLGYSVSASNNLSEEIRHSILDTAIINKLYSPSGIIKHLEWLIEFGSKRTGVDMGPPIAKWRHDINYIRTKYKR